MNFLFPSSKHRELIASFYNTVLSHADVYLIHLWKMGFLQN